jgi:hypothetical protein
VVGPGACGCSQAGGSGNAQAAEASQVTTGDNQSVGEREASTDTSLHPPHASVYDHYGTCHL